MIADEERDSGPWYKQFWAWFVFTPLIVVVLACSVMVTIAFKLKQDVVIDDYYKVGRMINQGFEPEKHAASMAVKAVLNFEQSELLAYVSANTALEDSLLLNLSHPVNADLDRYVTLIKANEGLWIANLKSPITGRWYVKLAEIDDGGAEVWRLQGEINLAEKAELVLP